MVKDISDNSRESNLLLRHVKQNLSVAEIELIKKHLK